MNTSINPSVIQQFLSSRIRKLEENYIHPPYEFELQLLEAIRLGNEERGKEILHKINTYKAATLAPNPLRSKKNSLIAACTVFTRAIIHAGVNPGIAFQLSDIYILEIEKAVRVEQLMEMEFLMLSHFIKTMNTERNNDSYSHSINLAIRYINENILQDLSLEKIAKHAYIHPAYLSSRFKQEVGLTVTECINKKRIEESKYFLLHTNSPISDIAILFRFCNQSYYTLLFKKNTGLTPREFREASKLT